jgi:hypothetical protein
MIKYLVQWLVPSQYSLHDSNEPPNGAHMLFVSDWDIVVWSKEAGSDIQ